MIYATRADEDETGLALIQIGMPFEADDCSLVQGDGPPPSLGTCGQALRRLKAIYGAARWWLGDLMNLTEGLFAEEASQVIDAELLTEAEAKAFMFVAGAVKPTVRAHAPSWEHARAVAGLKDPEQQAEWLDRARADDWSPRKLGTEIAKAAAVDGKTVMRWWLVVECGTEAKRDKLGARLEGEGFTVKRQEKARKVPKPKRQKKGPVTAQRRGKGQPKMNTRRRVPA